MIGRNCSDRDIGLADVCFEIRRIKFFIVIEARKCVDNKRAALFVCIRQID